MTKILIAGEGGQGIQVVAEILARAAFSEGLHSTYIPNFGVEQRGGVSIAFVVVDQKPIAYPKFREADVLVVFSNRSLDRVKNHAGKNTKIILGPTVEGGLKTDLPPKAWNILVLGKTNSIAEVVSDQTLMKEMENRFARQFEKDPSLKKLDEMALMEAGKR